MIFSILATLGFFENARWEQVIPPVICMLFLLLLFWYLTVRICLDLMDKVWRKKFSAEQSRRHSIEKANQAKAEFLATMSHEIRAPLNAIVSFTELATRTELDPDLQEHLGTVRTSAQWLIHIANDVTEFSRCSAGKVKLKNEPFSVKDCIESVHQMVLAQAEGRHLALHSFIDLSIPAQISGDGTRLLQVLFSLVENAVRCTTDGGVRITVVPESQTDSEIVLGFVVEDTGVGVPTDQLADFFKPLVHPAVAGQANGELRKAMTSAFGLPICEQNVSMMGGSLEVKSHLGAGTAVRFTAKFQPIPGHTAAARTERPVEPVPCSAARRLTILLGDQNPISRRLIKDILENAGHIVREAAEGLQVLHLFLEAPADLVLLDLEIAPIHGQEVIQALRAAERDGIHTPIYALLCQAVNLNRETCRTAGIHGFLNKPVDADAVLNIVAAIALSPPQTPSSGSWRLAERPRAEAEPLRVELHSTV